MSKLRKTFVVSVMFMTVLAMSVVVVPPVKAAAQAGDLIKMEGLSSVYYLGADGKRYVFPNETTYFSWYSDFSSVKTIPQSELESYPLGANVTIRPGTYLVKIQTDPKVYAVEPGGNLVWIPDEATAKALYGDNWASRVVDVPDAFFTNYTVTDEQVSSDAYPAGSLIKLPDSADVYYIDENGKARKIADEAAFNANRFNWDFVITTAEDFTLPELGAEITGAESDLTDTSEGAGGTAEAGTGLTVSLASDTPVSATIPSNATRVVFTKFNVTASNDGPVTIQSITVKRTGVGDPSELSKVYIYEGDTRLTTGKTINASTNEAQFTNINLEVPAGTTKTLSIVANIDNATGNHALGIESASAITTDGATVSGSFPIRGNTMSLSSTSAGSADVESSGSDYTRRTGQTDVEVGSFTVYVNSTEDAEFRGITLYNSGRDVLSNLELWRGSTKVADGVKNGSYFTFTLDTPYSIEKGQSASFTVKGDVSGRSDDTATLYVRYSTDVDIVGKTYGYGLKIDNAVGSDNDSYVEEVDSSPSSNTTTVSAGQVTVSLNGPAAGDVSKNTNDVVLMNFTITNETDVDFEKMTVVFSDSNNKLSVPNHTDDLELVCDGSSMWSVSSPTTTTIITDIWSLSAGSHDCTLKIDINNDAPSGAGIKATIKDLTSSSFTTIKDNNGDSVTDVVPSGDIAGNEQSITAASLTITTASTPAAGLTYVKGQSEADIVGFTFSAGEAEDVTVTAIKLTAYRDDDQGGFMAADKGKDSGAEDVMVKISIYDGDTLLGSKSLSVGSSDVSVTFDSLSWTIPAGQDKTLSVKADISTTLADNDNVAIAIADASDITAEYGNGSNLTPTVSNGNTNPDVYQTLVTSGSLTMSQDADTPTSALVVAGTEGVVFTKVKFSATNEDFVIDKLTIINDRYSSVGDDEFTAIVLEYTNSDGETETVSKGLSAGQANFTNLDIYVPKDDDTTVTVKANLNTVTNGADNGDYTSLKVASTSTFRATGQASGEVIETTGTSDVDGYDMYVYKSVPTFAFAADTPSGTLTPSANTLLAKIAVTADAADDITFVKTDGTATSSLTVKLALSVHDGTSTTATVTLKDGDGNTLDTVSGVAINSATTSVSVTFDFSNRQFTVPAGTTKYLMVYTDTTNLEDSGDTIQLWLDDDDANNIQWGINGSGNYHHADIIFKGDIFGGSLVKG